MYSEEERRLHEWLRDEHNPPVAETIYSQPLNAFQKEGLSVWPRVCWILTHHGLQRSFEPTPKEAFFSRELALIFIREDPTPDLRRRMDVSIGWGGERERLPLPRLAKSLLGPYARKRLYWPIGKLSARNIRSAVEAMYALRYVYLVQEGLVNFDENPTVQRFLFSYVDKFKKAKQVGVGSVLAHILGDYVFPKHSKLLNRSKAIDPQVGKRLRRYTLPEDYRAFSKYIKAQLRDC